jgi:purine catabolism regulator
MNITLRRILALPTVSTGEPEVLHGQDLLDREVRWVHSSDVYEIAAQLKGGELLLTSGLGLVGASDEQLRAYVASVAERGITALMFQLGRNFWSIPQPLLHEAEQHDVVLIALHQVVPFIQVTETVHELLINDEVSRLRRGEQICTQLTESLQSGGGMQSLLRQVAVLAGCPAVLLDGDDRIVAASEEEVPPSLAYDARHPVDVHGVEWGHLALAGTSPDQQVILDRSAALISMELARAGQPVRNRMHMGRELLVDMALNRYRSSAELSARATAAGLVTRRGHRLVAVCLSVNGTHSPRAIDNAAAKASRGVFGTFVMTRLDGDILIAGSADVPDDQAVRAVLQRLSDKVRCELSPGDGPGSLTVTVAAGSAVSEVPDLVRSLATARETSGLARRLGGRHQVLVSTDLSVHRLLAQVVGDPELGRFVEEQLGVLLEHDARRGRELVRTLDAYLANNLSKTHTAEALGVRRQTLYARLKRIEGLLGDLDLGERDRRTALDLALAAWRLRSTGAFHQHRRKFPTRIDG